MRIGLLSQWYDPEPTPTPSALACELQRREHSVKVLTGYPNYPAGRLYDGYRMRWREDALVAGIPVRRVALYPNHGPSKAGILTNYGSFAISASCFGASWFKDVEALWVYNSPPTVGLPTWLIKSRYRPRVVMHLMDLWPESLQASGYGGSMLSWAAVARGVDRWLAMTYDVVDSIACTSRTQMTLLADRGVPRGKLSYIPIWADESVFRPIQSDGALAATLGVTGKFVLLYAGAIGEPQGLDFLTDVCASLSNEPRFHCLIAGSGQAEPRLRRLAEQRDAKNISFLGRRPLKEMAQLMALGDIHLVSLRSDPLAEIAMPGKVSATLAAGKPMIVAAAGDAARVVAEAGAGWTCEPGNGPQLESAIRTALATDAAVLQAMGRNGRQAYESDFSVGVAATRLEHLLSGRVAEEVDVA